MNRRQQQSRFSLVIALALALPGCALLFTSIDEHTLPPYDWPELTRRSHYVEMDIIRKHCRDTFMPTGCAVINLHAKTCDKYFPIGRSSEYVEWHEEMHCKGYDHPGGTTIARLMNEYRMTTAEAK